jgi:hypothetical protein
VSALLGVGLKILKVPERLIVSTMFGVRLKILKVSERLGVKQA